MVLNGRAQRARVLGEVLRADYLLEGSVRRDGDRIRITARLVETNDEIHLWAETFERDLHGWLAVQTEVATRIASSLAVELWGGAQNPMSDPSQHLPSVMISMDWYQRAHDRLPSRT